MHVIAARERIKRDQIKGENKERRREKEKTRV
jgi:hypothetical protein